MKFCLGTVQFGLNYGIQGNGQPQEEKIFEMLSYAIKSGIDMFDTATAYGDAENVLGRYIRLYTDMGKKIGIVSKLRSDAFTEVEVTKWSEIAIQNAEESLERLGVGKLKAYLFHNASYIFDKRKVIALNSVKEVGIAEHIGVSIYTTDEAMKALEYPQIGAIQIPYNLFDQRLDQFGFFKKAKEQGILVFARSSLLQGLVMMDPDNLPDQVAFARDYLKNFLNICKTYKIDPLKVAIGYVGCKDGIDYVVFGVDNITQLKEYVALMEITIPDKVMKTIETTFKYVEDRLVNPVLWK